MRNFIYIKYMLLFFMCLVVTIAYSKNYDPTSRHKRKYVLALHVDNPISAMFKYGGGLESRGGQSSYFVGYNKYYAMSAYPGSQMNIEYMRYIRTKKRHEWFWYVKYLIGGSGYDDTKLEIYGNPGDITILPVGYQSFGGGIGRRYNFGHAFASFEAGLKYTQLYYFSDYMNNIGLNIGRTGADERPFYNLFLITGPGSYVDFHVRIGLQI